jgi:hypothetical protein
MNGQVAERSFYFTNSILPFIICGVSLIIIIILYKHFLDYRRYRVTIKIDDDVSDRQGPISPTVPDNIINLI